MRYIDTLKEFKGKYGFYPRAGLISEYIRIYNTSNNLMVSVYALCHAMRLGYDINS